ncbi:MAG: phage terminase large subunit family protein [Bacteroidaceae bacterium]|nr:phage terminase large subunit family protein [Bacteroidaceae bacterium]
MTASAVEHARRSPVNLNADTRRHQQPVESDHGPAETMACGLLPSESSPDFVNSVREILERPDCTDSVRRVHRAEFLPHLFRLKGKPYSLQGREQFYPFYDNEYTPEFIAMTGRQLGKSKNLSCSEILDLISVPELQLLYVAPLQSQTNRYSTLYVNEAISSCELARMLQTRNLEGELSDSKVVKSVGHQAFANGSGIQLTYAKTSPDRVRGITADRIDFDEIQDQLIDNIPIIAESLTASEWGCRRYTGTAKTLDNTIERLWQRSSMAEWVIKCDHCGTWNIPTMEGRVLDMIQADGIHCVHCGGRLNASLGQWVEAHPSRHNDFRGYHIPQIVVPAIVDNPEKWARLIRDFLRQPLPIFVQEKLGISQSMGSRLITEKDVLRQCTLPPVDELQKNLSRYAFTVSAIDWGGAEQSSFTVHVVLGIRPDGRIDVIWAQRFIGFDPDEVLTRIAEAHRFYGCTMCAADYGMGFDKNIILEKRFGMMMAQFQFVRQSKLLSYSPTLGHARWTLDKTTALDILFLSIRKGRIYFPDSEEFQRLYVPDLLSPYEEVLDKGGLNSRRYLRDPSRPDDFCMALCFGATLAMKLLYGDDDTNMIPVNAFGTPSTSVDAPQDNPVDPQDVLQAL